MIPLFIHELLGPQLSDPVKPYLVYQASKVTGMQIAARLRILLREVGEKVVGRGTYCLVMESDPAWTVAFLALSSLRGAVFTPLASCTKHLPVIREKLPQARIVTFDQGKLRISDHRTILLEALLPSDCLESDGRLFSACPDMIDVDPALMFLTTGTTGFPKGILLSHNAVIGAAESIQRYLRLSSKDHILNLNPLSFDYGFYQLLLASTAGATCHLFPTTEDLSPMAIGQYISQNAITVLPLVPSLARVLVSSWFEASTSFETVRLLTFTGSTFPGELMRELNSVFPQSQIYSMYGATECKRISYLDPSRLNAKPYAVGKAIPNLRVIIDYTDSSDQVSHNGEPCGTITVEGRANMLGYWNFADNTYTPAGKRIATGDIGFFDQDGDINLIGRSDDLVKVNDQRLSLMEIERSIRAVAGVLEAAVSTVTWRSNTFLGCAITLKPKEEPELVLSRLRQNNNLKEFFPLFKRVEFLGRMPLLTNGKIDRHCVHSLLNNAHTKE
jgi:long-chain acyl-CoA synthetase